MSLLNGMPWPALKPPRLRPRSHGLCRAAAACVVLIHLSQAVLLAEDHGTEEGGCTGCHGVLYTAALARAFQHDNFIVDKACAACHVRGHLGTEAEGPGTIGTPDDPAVNVMAWAALGKGKGKTVAAGETGTTDEAATAAGPHHVDVHDNTLYPSFFVQIEGCRACHNHLLEASHPVGISAYGMEAKPPFDLPTADGIITCTTCHNPHASGFQYLTRYHWERDLCVQCHRGRRFLAMKRGKVCVIGMKG